MSFQPDIVNKIRGLVERNNKLEEERANDGSTVIDYDGYERQIDKLLQDIQNQVKQQESVLEEVCIA